MGYVFNAIPAAVLRYVVGRGQVVELVAGRPAVAEIPDVVVSGSPFVVRVDPERTVIKPRGRDVALLDLTGILSKLEEMHAEFTRSTKSKTRIMVKAESFTAEIKIDPKYRMIVIEAMYVNVLEEPVLGESPKVEVGEAGVLWGWPIKFHVRGEFPVGARLVPFQLDFALSLERSENRNENIISASGEDISFGVIVPTRMLIEREVNVNAKNISDITASRDAAERVVRNLEKLLDVIHDVVIYATI